MLAAKKSSIKLYVFAYQIINMETRLLQILVCPICKGSLDYHKEQQELICKADKLAYPIRDGVPVMLTDEARSLESTEK